MIKLKKKPFDNDGIPVKHRYYIMNDNVSVGEIIYKPYHKDYILVGHLDIYPAFRGLGFGYATVEYLLNRYPNRSLIGETLKTSRGFWRKCIERYNGIRKNLFSCDNCTSSFVIPKRDISYEELWDCLMVAYDIN